MKNIAFIFITFFLSFLLIELISLFYLIAHYGRLDSAPDYYSEIIRHYETEIRGKNCETFYYYIDPHPYLAHSSFNFENKCDHGLDDTFGYISQKYNKFKKLQDKYVILITGGSVAFHMSSLTSKNVNNLQVPFFQKYLNENFKSPNGKPFYVINTSVPGGSYPQQIISFLLNKNVIDLMISLEGYNEFIKFTKGYHPELPNDSFFWSNSYFHSDESIRLRSISNLFNTLKRNVMAKNTYVGILILKYLRSYNLNKNIEFNDKAHKLKNLYYDRNIVTKRLENFKKHYYNYIEKIKLLSINGSKAFIFFQPNIFFKKLTSREKEIVLKSKNLDDDQLKLFKVYYKDFFKEISDKFPNTTSNFTEALIDDENEIFTDHCHMLINRDKNNIPYGHLSLIKLITKELVDRSIILKKTLSKD